MNTYVVTKDADMMAPDWLTARINYKTVKFIYVLRDGAETLKGVRLAMNLQRLEMQLYLTASGYP